MKRQRNGGEVRKDRGVIVNRTSGTSFFLSGRRQKGGRGGGRDGSHKYLTFHLSDWQTHTHKYQTPTSTPARTTAYICKSVLVLRVNRFPARRRGNCVKVNNMAGGVLTRRRWRPGDEITVPPVGYNGD